jgi:hypothetical protein
VSDSRYSQVYAGLQALYGPEGVFGKRLAAIATKLLDSETKWEEVERLRGEHRGLHEVLVTLGSLAREEESRLTEERAEENDRRRAAAMQRHGLSPFRR